MDVNSLFTLALGLQQPWTVVGLDFHADEKRLDIRVDFPRGSEFPCPVCSAACKVHDADEHEWRHLNFFEHLTFLRARQPRTKCTEHGVKTVPVPWARPGAGFTLLMEAVVVELARNGMTATAIGRLLGEHDTRIWRVLEHYVGAARARTSFEGTTSVAVDETSRAKGHVYVTLFADPVKRKVLFVTEGKDHTTLAAFKDDLVEHGGSPAEVEEFSLDMSKAFIKGINEVFPEAHLTFDRFHVVKLMNEAVDEVRRGEQRAAPELKKTRFLWLKNKSDLKADEKERFAALLASTIKTAQAYRFKVALQGVYDQPARYAPALLRSWILWASLSGLPPVERVARTIEEHLDGVLRWFKSGLTNGLLEGMNSLVQAAKAKARGFRSARKMKVVIYLLLSKLDFQLPQPFPSAIHPK